MAKKDRDKQQEELKSTEVRESSTAADSPAIDGRYPQGYVRVENLMPMEFGVTLRDGTHLNAGPKRSQHNISRAVAKKLLPPHVNRMVRNRQVRIIDGGAK